MIGALPGVIATRHAAPGIASPDDIAGLQQDWNADVGVATGATMTWTDQKNGYVASQATAANQPTVQANALNGYDVVRFDGSNDFLATSSATTGQDDMTVVAVVKLNSAFNGENQSPWAEFLSSGPSTRRALVARRSADGSFAYFSDPGATTFRNSTVDPTVDTWYVLTITVEMSGTTANLAYYVNGVAAGTDTAGNPTDCDRVWLGKAGSSSGYLKGDLARVLKYSRKLTTTELKNLHNLIGATTYAIHSTIP
jgi:hypothetical protein